MGFFKIRPPLASRADSRLLSVRRSTAPSTGLGPGGVFALETTSTGAPVVSTLNPPRAGTVLEVAVSLIASSSLAPFHINAGAGVTFGSSDGRVALSSAGAGFRAVGLSSSKWLITGSHGSTFGATT